MLEVPNWPKQNTDERKVEFKLANAPLGRGSNYFASLYSEIIWLKYSKRIS